MSLHLEQMEARWKTPKAEAQAAELAFRLSEYRYYYNKLLGKFGLMSYDRIKFPFAATICFADGAERVNVVGIDGSAVIAFDESIYSYGHLKYVKKSSDQKKWLKTVYRVPLSMVDHMSIGGSA